MTDQTKPLLPDMRDTLAPIIKEYERIKLMMGDGESMPDSYFHGRSAAADVFERNMDTIINALRYVRADRPISGDMKAVRDALNEAHEELWSEWHSHMTEAEFDAHPTIQEINAARAALSRIEAAQSSGVADGWQLVPKEPTDAMMQAAAEFWLSDEEIESRASLERKLGKAYWGAMIAAAPKADTKTGDE